MSAGVAVSSFRDWDVKLSRVTSVGFYDLPGPQKYVE